MIERKQQLDVKDEKPNRFQHTFSYADYIKLKYHRVDQACYEKRNSINVVAIAALIEAIATQDRDYFEAIFIRLFGKENLIHLENIKVMLETESTNSIYFYDMLPMLLGEVWQPRVHDALAKLELISKKYPTLPEDQYLFHVMQQLLEINIVVFSSSFKQKTIYTNCHQEREIVLVNQDLVGKYDYLTKHQPPSPQKEKEDKVPEGADSVVTTIVDRLPTHVLFKKMQSVPTELKTHIQSFLSEEDMLSIKFVNKEWCELTKEWGLHLSKESTENKDGAELISTILSTVTTQDGDIVKKFFLKRGALDVKQFIFLSELCFDIGQTESKQEVLPQLTDDQYTLLGLLIDNDTAKIKEFIDAHPELNVNFFFRAMCVSPLFLSSWFGNEEVVKILKDRGCTLLPDNCGISSENYFSAAAKLPTTTFLEIIINHLSSAEKLTYKMDKESKPFPVIYAPMRLALQNKPSINILKKLIEKGTKIDDLKPYRSGIPFLYDFLSNEGTTFGNHTADVFALLVKHGIDHSYFEFKNSAQNDQKDMKVVSKKSGLDCLYRAAADSSRFLQPLFEKYPEFCAAAVKNHSSKLLCAATGGSPDAVRFLMKHGCNIASIVDDDENTSRHHLLSHSIKYRKNNLFGEKIEFITPYQRYHQYIELIKEIIKDPVKILALLTLRNRNGETPFLLAAKTHSYDVLELFKTPDNKSITDVDNNGNTAMHLAMDCFCKHDSSNMAAAWPTVKTLLEFKQLDLAAKNNKGLTVFDLANVALKKMLDTKENNYTSDNNKRHHLLKICYALALRMEKTSRAFKVLSANLLHAAVIYRYLPILKELIAYPHFDVNQLDDRGLSPLMRICFTDYESKNQLDYPRSFLQFEQLDYIGLCDDSEINCIKELLKSPNIDINQSVIIIDKGSYLYLDSNNLPLTPLMAAVSRNDTRLFSLLLSHPKLRLAEKDFLIFLKLLIVSLNSSTRHAQAENMIIDLLKRPDLIPIPAISAIKNYQEYDYTTRDYYNILFKSRNNAIIRLAILHPNFSRNAKKEQDLFLNKEMCSYIKNELNEYKFDDYYMDSNEKKNIWTARVSLFQAEQILKTSTSKNNKIKDITTHLEAARKHDGASLDIYIRQIFSDFRAEYSFDAFQRAQLLKHPAVLASTDVQQLMFLADLYEMGQDVEQDLLIALSLYEKANNICQTMQDKQKSISIQQKIDNHISSLKGKLTQESKQTSIDTNSLINQFKKHIKPTYSIWKDDISVEADKIVKFLMHLDKEPVKAYVSLLERYADLKCREIMPELVKELKNTLLSILSASLMKNATLSLHGSEV